jgi:ABC-type multidrug transport system ATPase subunit
MDRALALARLDAVFIPVLEMLPLLGIAAVLWLGGRSVINGDLTVGSFVAFNAYVVMLVWPLRVLGQRVTTLQKALAASSRITEVLEAEPQLREPRHPVELEAHGDIRLEGVRFGHEGDRFVLDGLDLHVAPGESLALVGATGSGKSTVAGLLARLYDPDEGRVLLDGHDLRELRIGRRPPCGRARLRGDVPVQRERAREHPPRAAGRDEWDVASAAELAGAAAFVADLPDGYETVLGERGFSLSGGQRQRIAIARAILADPAVLVLDDATSAVDATKEHEIRAALSEVMQGRTTLVIAHRPATIALADRVAVLEGGRIVEQGTHEELIARSPATASCSRSRGRMMERATAREVWRETRGLTREVQKLYFGAAAAVIVSTLITLSGPHWCVTRSTTGSSRRPASAQRRRSCVARARAAEAARRARADAAGRDRQRALPEQAARGRVREVAGAPARILRAGADRRARVATDLGRAGLDEFLREALVEVVGAACRSR